MVDSTNLDDYIESRNPDDIYNEIRNTLNAMPFEIDLGPLDKLFDDLKGLFAGRYPGYRASNTKYHDLEHTCFVALATARLMHGYIIATEAGILTDRHIYMGIAAAFFHDTGLIQEIGDTEGTGAKYTAGHEARSILLMEKILARHAALGEFVCDGAHAIRCTIVTDSIDDIPFQCEAVKIIGKIVGSADLLAQMGDRKYLEKLILLFEEFQEARLSNFDTALDLLHKTKDFYQTTARYRLVETLGNVTAFMKYHFKARWGVDLDPYEAAISNNILYLSHLIDICGNNYLCFLKNLKRGGIAPNYIDAVRNASDVTPDTKSCPPRNG